MAGIRHISTLEDMAINALAKHSLFNIDVPANSSIERSVELQHAAQCLVEKKILDKVMPDFLQAVVDDNRKKVSELLEKNPELLLVEPRTKLVIESQLTWQKFYAEKALMMAVKRKQIKMIGLLLPYYDKLEQTEDVIKAKAEALSAWKPYTTIRTDENSIFYKVRIVVLPEYAALAQSLIDVFKEAQEGTQEEIQKETFPHGVPGSAGVPMNVALGDKIELALSSLLNILVPKKAVKLDEHIDVELLLLAIYKAYLKNFAAFNYNWDRLNALCIRVIGLTQSALIPETGEIFCEGLEDVVIAIHFGDEKEISPLAASHKLKKDADLYHVSRTSRSGSGFDFLCGMDASPYAEARSDLSSGGQISRSNFCRFMEQKQQIFGYAAIAATAKPSPSK